MTEASEEEEGATKGPGGKPEGRKKEEDKEGERRERRETRKEGDKRRSGGDGRPRRAGAAAWRRREGKAGRGEVNEARLKTLCSEEPLQKDMQKSVLNVCFCHKNRGKYRK